MPKNTLESSFWHVLCAVVGDDNDSRLDRVFVNAMAPSGSFPVPAILLDQFDQVRDDLVALEAEFERDAVSDVQVITEIGEYLRAGGGKRIRPALLLLSAKLFDYQGRGAVRLGAVVEIRTADEMRKIIPQEIAKWTKVAIEAGMPRNLH